MMKRLLAVTGLFVAMSCAASAQKAELTAKEVTEHLQRRYEMIDDAVVEFRQHVKFGFSNIEQTFEGTFSTRKPNKYRVESEHQTIVTDGTTVWAYSPVNKQVVIDRYKENQNSVSPEQFMLNMPTNYYVALLGTEKGKEKEAELAVLKLTPKDDRSFVKTVKVWVEEGTWMVKKVMTVDINDTETTYTINDMKLNTNLKDKTFTFVPPPGTEVVDLR